MSLNAMEKLQLLLQPPPHQVRKNNGYRCPLYRYSYDVVRVSFCYRCSEQEMCQCLKKYGSTYNIVALVPPPDFQALLRALCILKATQKAPDFLACQIQTACYRFKPKSFDVIFRCRATVF